MRTIDTRSEDEIIKCRWAGFINFERKVKLEKIDTQKAKTKSCKTVMVGSPEIQDVLPAQRKISSIFRFDDCAIKPKFTEIQGVKWITNRSTEELCYIHNLMHMG